MKKVHFTIFIHQYIAVNPIHTLEKQRLAVPNSTMQM